MGAEKPPPANEQWQAMHDFAADLVDIEQRLHQAGFHATARQVNTAVQQIGWEFAARLERERAEGDTNGR